MRLGIVDIGTNSIHSLIVRIDPDLKFHVIEKAKEMVRLGQGTFESGRLDEGVQRRALDFLGHFRRLADRRGVEHFLAVATSAVREADNGGAFLQEVYERTGIHARIISGVDEGRLCFRAVQSILPLDEDYCLVVDLGGGSAQFACGNNRQIAWATSLKLGVQRLETQILRHGEVSPERYRVLKEQLAKDLAPLVKKAKANKVKRCYITSGSGTAVLGLLQGMDELDETADAIPRKLLQDLDHDLPLLPRARRKKLPGLEPERVDLIVGAVAFLGELVGQLNLQELKVSDRGLREGLVLEYVDRHGAELQWELTEPNSRRRAVLQLAERFHYDAAHAQHVARLAVELFDATHDLHGLDETARELLEYGALLHDIGYVVSESNHHKHSEYLILHGLAGGFTDTEIRMIAGIARYHRKALPSSNHSNWRTLGKDPQEVVRKAGSLIRIADGLDRGHMRVVTGLSAARSSDSLVIQAKSAEPAGLEIWAAKRKSDLFREIFGLDVELKVRHVNGTGRTHQEAKPRAVRRQRSKST